MGALLKACSHLDGEVFADAIERHIHNTFEDRDGRMRGSWAPKPTDVLHQAQAIQTENARYREEEIQATQKEIDENSEWVPIPIPEDARKYFQERETLEIRRGKHSCSHCSDKGLARFYYDAAKPADVWLFTDFARIPTGLHTRISATVLCDCKIGQLKEPQYRGALRLGRCMPMRYLRRLVDVRLKREREAV